MTSNRSAPFSLLLLNCEFEVIHTVVLASNLNQYNFPSSHTFELPSLPSNVDQMIVKQISWFAEDPVGSFFLWNDFTNSCIANIMCDGTSELLNCNIPIQVAPNACPSNITFALREMNDQNQFVTSTDSGKLTVTLQFIRFAR